jgi:hypothetical protein
MVLPNNLLKGMQFIGVVGLSSLFVASNVYAQGGLPLPGGSGGSSYSAEPVVNPFLARPGGTPATNSRYSAPVPGSPAPGGAPVAPGLGASPGAAASTYDKLPLNPGNAIARLEELRNLMPNSRPKEFFDSVSEYIDWLSDMADAHWKLSQAFGKQDSTKAQAETERQLCLRFGSLKRQATLLKAEFLIGQHRYPEALGPLVDIVTAEPRTETGQNAYRLLQQIGFSDANSGKLENATGSGVPH